MFEESAGVIPVHRESRDILLVCEREGYWGFPKGHLESGETALQAALRELKEETGIVKVDLQNEPIVKMYSFEKNGVQITKKVSYFLGFVEDKSVVVREGEIQDFGWFSYEEARSKVTFAKEVLDSIKL